MALFQKVPYMAYLSVKTLIAIFLKCHARFVRRPSKILAKTIADICGIHRTISDSRKRKEALAIWLKSSTFVPAKTNNTNTFQEP
jgi:hypothetical protein